jgi:hypothetical protein
MPLFQIATVSLLKPVGIRRVFLAGYKTRGLKHMPLIERDCLAGQKLIIRMPYALSAWLFKVFLD